MSASVPPLPPELVAFAEGGVSLLIATAGADLVPEAVRGMGVRIWPGACRATVLVPAATAATTIANLRTNPRLAFTLSHVPTHRTVQIKGAVLAVRDGGPAERQLATQYRIKLAEELAFAGQAPANTLRLAIWPCWAVDVEIEVVYAQTPGPAAGVKLPLESGRP